MTYFKVQSSKINTNHQYNAEENKELITFIGVKAQQ